VLLDVMLAWRRRRAFAAEAASRNMGLRHEWPTQLGWLLAFAAIAVLFGLSPGLPLATGLYLHAAARLSLVRVMLSVATMLLLFELLFGWGLGLFVFRGLLLGGV
jgi:hypothetical protein